MEKGLIVKYLAPEMEVVEVAVEQGFQTSTPGGYLPPSEEE